MNIDVNRLKGFQAELENQAAKLREEILRLEGEFRGHQKLIDLAAAPTDVPVTEPANEPAGQVSGQVPVTVEGEVMNGETTPAT